MKLLIVEDDLRLMRTLERDLREEGYSVEVAWDGLQGLEIAQQHDFDLILLDGMLPGIDGWQFVERLRASKDTPVLMLTARDEIPKRVEGLEAGADDYLTKPFHFDELLARIRALIRRNSGAHNALLRYEDLVMNTDAKTAERAGRTLDLTAREFLILQRLLTRQGHILSNEQLSSYLSNNSESVGLNTIEVHISRLRKKVGKDIIYTVRGMGYTIRNT